jgi:hypothetical protein
VGVFKSNIPRDGLICYLDAANIDSYPRSGTIVYDLSGSGNNATLSGGYSFNTSNGGVLVFDGSSGKGVVTGFNMTSSNHTVIGGARYVSPSGRIFAGYSNNWLMGWWNTTTENYYAEGWVSAVSSGAADTSWRIEAATGDISKDLYTLYVNSVPTVRNNTGGSQGPNGITLASHANGSGDFASAWVSFMLVYNRVLNPYEISEIYRTFKGRLGL